MAKTIKQINDAQFDSLNDLEKVIRNEYYIISSIKKSIQILKDNGSDYIPIVVLKDEATSRESFLAKLLDRLANGDTEP